jgi:hypothetical protein
MCLKPLFVKSYPMYSKYSLACAVNSMNRYLVTQGLLCTEVCWEIIWGVGSTKSWGATEAPCGCQCPLYEAFVLETTGHHWSSSQDVYKRRERKGTEGIFWNLHPLTSALNSWLLLVFWRDLNGHMPAQIRSSITREDWK